VILEVVLTLGLFALLLQSGYAEWCWLRLLLSVFVMRAASLPWGITENQRAIPKYRTRRRGRSLRSKGRGSDEEKDAHELDVMKETIWGTRTSRRSSKQPDALGYQIPSNQVDLCRLEVKTQQNGIITHKIRHSFHSYFLFGFGKLKIIN
jgi:hypothetical protein